MLPPQGCKPLLLRVRVDICTDDESDDVEERHPGVLGEELLRKGQGDGRDDPADLHDRHEAGLDSRAHLVEGARARNDGHGNQVDAVLDGRDLGALAGSMSLYHWWVRAHNQIANENLENLGLEARPAAEDFLQQSDEDVAERSADEGAVNGHLGDAGSEVIARLAPVVGNPRREKLLEAREGSRRKHLGAQRVLLEVFEVDLRALISTAACRARNGGPLTAR